MNSLYLYGINWRFPLGLDNLVPKVGSTTAKLIVTNWSNVVKQIRSEYLIPELQQALGTQIDNASNQVVSEVYNMRTNL